MSAQIITFLFLYSRRPLIPRWLASFRQLLGPGLLPERVHAVPDGLNPLFRWRLADQNSRQECLEDFINRFACKRCCGCIWQQRNLKFEIAARTPCCSIYRTCPYPRVATFVDTKCNIWIIFPHVAACIGTICNKRSTFDICLGWYASFSMPQ